MSHVGVDIGGTFTDIVVMDEERGLVTTKSPTTPGELERGVFDGLGLIAAERQMSLEQFLTGVESFGHGTTQATNALIERTGATTALLTTAGFGDTLFIQRLMGFTTGLATDELGWYSRRSQPQPIVPRRLVREITERVDQSGRVLVPLDEAAARGEIENLLAAGVEAFAVSLLWSFKNPEHEQRLRDLIRVAAGRDLFISLSSDVSPVIGEYERTATTVLNSYLGPVVAAYLDRLERGLRDRGFDGQFSVMNSIGGVMSAHDAAAHAVLLLASGPSGGVIGSRYLAEMLGHDNVITTDMGGTSFDVGLILDGRPTISSHTEVGGYHLSASMVDITAIGSGGGSIATVEDGMIRVGPESAGAMPGPVCYQRGGTRATVTDADLVLGVIDPETFLGGRMKLDKEAAEAAIAEQIAEPLGEDVVRAAAGIRRIVDSQMADTLRQLTIGRGHDPRDFVLYAYGGAGPMHCAGFGSDLGAAKIVVPAVSMVQSAYGALASDIHHSAERSYLVRAGGGAQALTAGIEVGEIEERFQALEAECLERLRGNGIEAEQAELRRSVDMRFRRQTHELIVPVEPGVLDEAALEALFERFERTYEDTYGKGAAFREAGIEMTTFRVDAIGRRRKPDLQATAPVADDRQESRRVYDTAIDDYADAVVAHWGGLAAGSELPGPAVVEHPTTTVFVGSGQVAAVDPHGNLVIQERSKV
ncbi:MAG: hydantoinase/oxoprolinase family protein [Actinobacteria bacterium]|nr:hydantoinase/oxoprolinase family protein [Actinomycetota bacterium]